MRKKILVDFALILTLSSLVAFRLYNNNGNYETREAIIPLEVPFNLNNNNDSIKDKVLSQVVTQFFKMLHYNVVASNNELSKNMYEIYLKKLDYNKRFLLKTDVDTFNLYKNLLIPELAYGSYHFFTLTTKTLEIRTIEAHRICNKILKTPFNFKKNEKFEIDPKKQDYPKNNKERYKRWHALLKYQAMVKLDRFLKWQEDSLKLKNVKYVKKSYASLEKRARKELADDYKEVFRRYSQINHSDWLSTYLNSYVECYDPHSQYMAPKVREDFDIGISGKLEGIGATLTSRGGYIKVVKIMPGSPSWKQGQLKEEDLIIQVAQGDSAAVNVVDMRLDEAVKLIRGKKGTVVKLTVKKPDNTIVVIPIVRDVVMLEETFAKSAILQMKNSDKRYGYIYLPSFYVDFRHFAKGRNCAEDVRKEIVKLKKEQVDGILFDLRNNSGGSLQEVVKIAGFFIKDGPVVQVRSRNNKIDILKDRDHRIQYDGDLVVLVNHFSASASEIFAAAMQDYKRAVIVGSEQTHGKGTVQNIIDIDRHLHSRFNSVKPLGVLRLTIQKYYRINGGATQRKGVTPDIILPDIYDAYDTGEGYLPNALKWDEIAAANYNEWPLPSINMNELKQHSRVRVDSNQVFQRIIESTKLRRQERKNTLTSLNLKKHREEQDRLSAESKKLSDVLKRKTSVKSLMLPEDVQNFRAIMDKSVAENTQVDSSKFISRKHWVENLEKDPYVAEGLEILQEMK